VTNNFKISNIIELHRNVIMVVYTDLESNSNDVILVKDKPKSKHMNEFCYKTNDAILTKKKLRKNTKKTDTITLEFEKEFFDAVTIWCDSLKITLEHLVYAFIEFVAMWKNRDVVIPWMKELQNEQH